MPTLSPASVSSPQGGGPGSFDFSMPSTCNWTAASNVGWITVTGSSSGSGNGTVNYSVAQNSGPQRVGTITVNGQAFNITQNPNPASCGYSLSKTNDTFPQEGGSRPLALTAGAGCAWNAVSSDTSWLTASPTNGVGSATINYSVTANSGQQRVGSISITVGGQTFATFTVTQLPNQASCTFALSPGSSLSPVEGGNGSFSVTTGAGCIWNAENNNGWITITGGATNPPGGGSGTVTFNVHANNGGSRTGSILVRGQVFTITQCGFQVSPTSASFGPDGGTGSVTVSAAADCSWSAIATSWISITSGQSGVGNGIINYRVAAFNVRFVTRTGTISVGNQVVTIDQAGIGTAGPASTPTIKQTGMLLSPGNDAGPTATRPHLNAPGPWLAIPFSRAGLVLLIACGVLALLLRIKRRQAHRQFTTSPANVVSRLRDQIASRLEELFRIAAAVSDKIQFVAVFGKRLLAGTSNKLNVAVFVKKLFAGASDKLKFVGHFLAALPPTFKAVSRGAVMRLGKQKLARRSLEIVRIVARQALSLWRSSGVARLNPLLRRALTIALIVRLAAPLTPAEAAGIVRAAQTAWREARAYVVAISNRPVNMAPVRRSGMVASAAAQAEQVDELQVCPRQLVMFVGERYTLTPVALDVNPGAGSKKVVHGVGMSWSSPDISVARVSSFGQVEAMGVGNTAVEVQCGGVSKHIPVEVRSGTRPTGSNQQADIDPTNDCADEQSSAFAPQSAAVAPAPQSLIDGSGVSLDWDPESAPGSRATHFRNAVGAPRFTAKSQGVALGSSNYQFNVTVAGVGGRGASAGIGMTFNSRVWNADDGKLTFNYVGAYPAPGWTIGYGKIIRNYNATGSGDKSGIGSGNNPGDYLLVTGDGTRVRLAAKYNAATGRWLHESDDGSFLQFNPISGEMRYPDGSRTIYSSVNGCLLPTAMINSNGGAITMTYRDYCEGAGCVRVFRHRTALSAVRDTLGRYVTFHYYGDSDYAANAANGHPAGELAAIKAPDTNGVQQEVIRVEYMAIALKYDFGGVAVDAPANNSQIQVVRRIYYPQTGRGFLFLDYSSYGMPRKISSRMGMTGAGGAITDGTEIAYTTYNYMTIDPSDPYGRHQNESLSDFPQFTRREEWWQGKTDATGAPTAATTKYDYSRTTNGSTEVATIKYVDKNCEEVTTTGTDSGQLSFGKPISVELKNSTTGAALNKQVFTYMNGPDGEAEIKEVETFDEDGRSSLVVFSYGRYGRVTDRYEHGYKQGGGYQVRRRTHNDYVDVESYLAARFLRLVSRVSVYDANGALKAKTETTYDDYAAMGGIESYGLNPSLYPPNHDAAYDQTKVMRGNVTAVKTFSRFNPEEATTRGVRYDIFGNVVAAEVSCCVKKFFGFSGVTAYSQPDWLRSGPESGLNLQTNYQYNYFTGLVERETNPDGLPTSYEYDRALRLKRVTDEATGAVAETEFQDDIGNDLLTHVSKVIYDDQETQRVIIGKKWFNGLGQVIQAGTGTGDAPDSYDMTATVYDGWGRVAKQSNPYLGDASGAPQAGVTQYWTTNTYDVLSRVTEVKLPDTQTIQTIYNGAPATSGATVIATDTVGRKRKSEVDGLGRLVKVTEQNPANGNLEWETSYSYDALDNLTQINQGGQLRTFTYDAKSRLKSETTPEAGMTTYDYTDFDAVSSRTDARGVVTTYTYGDLNLLTGVSYNNVTGVAPTAPMSIDYRNASPGKGQIKRVTDGAGIESYSYDSFGRLQSCTREIDGISYEKRYEYNAAGQMTLMTYPSGKRVKVGRDARGRLSAMQRVDASNNVQDTYLSDINYRVDGLVSGQNLGDGTTESFEYSDDQLQLTKQKVMKGGSTLLDLSYGYGALAGQMGNGSTAGNSGQLVSVTGTINGQGRNQVFTYDNVGRLVTAAGWGAWARRFDYDRYGNRTAVWNAVSGGSQLQNTVIGQVAGIKTNRIESVNGTAFIYDAGGNVTGDGARVYTYDAENRIVSVSGSSSESYGYDAGNRRVKKEAGGVVTHYIWEGNQVIAEYERGGGATPATGTRYYHQDRLSTRIITNSAGAVVGTTDQLPFGEEIGVSGVGEKHKFTTYERDSTGLDYAVNRHYDPRQGRFNQVDPLGMGAASLADPQSLNLYGYVRNDPVNSVDPSGLRPNLDPHPYGLGGSMGSSSFYIDGIPASASLALSLLQSGVGVIGPLDTTRWDPELNQGKGGFKHLRVDANGKASWGYWSEVTTRAVDAARNELWSYTDTEWHMTMIGDLTFRNGMLGVDTSGVLRDFNGNIITGGEQPIEMQMLGPLDFIGPGELKFAALIAGGLKGLAINWSWKSVPTWGHTFLRHGAGSKITRELMGRAASTGEAQGQWLSNKAAAEFLRGFENVPMVGPFSARIPEGLGRVILPGGQSVAANGVVIIPSAKGFLKTAYPIFIPGN